MRWKIETYADADGNPSFRIFAGAAGQDLICEVYSRELADAIAGLPEVTAVATMESVIARVRAQLRERIFAALAKEQGGGQGKGEGSQEATDATA